MSAVPADKFRPYDFSHLCLGDLIEARQNQRVHHRGHIEEAHPDLGVFWIQDTITGSRRLIDFDSFEIFFGRPAQAVPATG